MTNQKILLVLAMVASTASVFPVAEAGVLRGSERTEDSLTQEERRLKKSSGMGMSKGMGGKSNKNNMSMMTTGAAGNSLNLIMPQRPPPLIIAPSTNTYISVAKLQEDCNTEWSGT